MFGEGPRTFVHFWDDMEAEINLARIAEMAIPVKGVSYHDPLRFLDIFLNGVSRPTHTHRHGPTGGNRKLSWRQVTSRFFPRIPGVAVRLGSSISKPPFTWRNANPVFLALSFTYNTNALYRILSILRDERVVEASRVDNLLDNACLLLSSIYRARNHFLLRNTNNNFNMYLLSKVIESTVGPTNYCADRQEERLTRQSLMFALELARAHTALSTEEKMALALGKGVTFVESHLAQPVARLTVGVEDMSFRFFERRLAIDHRHRLLSQIERAGRHQSSFVLAVILDDTAESVDDLLWINDIMAMFPFLKVNLLLNTAKISINFSADMLDAVLAHPSFSDLASRYGNQLIATEIYCPFISFETEYLPPAAHRVIDAADAVFIKGANFFETCQLTHKNRYHGFVVFGPISRAYTGLQDFDAVFVHLPAGVPGYIHRNPPAQLTQLQQLA